MKKPTTSPSTNITEITPDQLRAIHGGTDRTVGAVHAGDTMLPRGGRGDFWDRALAKLETAKSGGSAT